MAIPASALKRNRYIRLYHDAGATEPSRAIRPADVGLDDTHSFRKLVQRGIFVAVDENRFYLDAAAAETYRGDRRVVVLIAVAVVLVAIVVMYLAGVFR